MTPLTGFHWVIDRPDPVARVAPPTTTMATTSAATAASQTAARRERWESPPQRAALGAAASGRRPETGSVIGGLYDLSADDDGGMVGAAGFRYPNPCTASHWTTNDTPAPQISKGW